MLNIGKIIGKFIKNSSQRELDHLKTIVEKINAWEPKIKEMPDENFPTKTAEFKSKIQNETSLDDLIPETFACVREAARRTLGEPEVAKPRPRQLLVYQGATKRNPGEEPRAKGSSDQDQPRDNAWRQKFDPHRNLSPRTTGTKPETTRDNGGGRTHTKRRLANQLDNNR